jgi:hypothetical protein
LALVEAAGAFEDVTPRLDDSKPAVPALPAVPQQLARFGI